MIGPRVFAAIGLAGLLSACAVGPDYVAKAPAPAEAGAFVESRASPTLSTQPLPASWWRLFEDPVLDRLVGEALAHNTDLRVASANLRQARALLSEALSGRLPSTDLSAGYTRQRIGLGAQPALPAGTGVDAITTDLFTLGFDASYEVDLFGRVSRSVEAARGDRDAAAAALDAARVSIAAETARSYAQLCGFAAQVDVARETVRLQDQTLDLTRRLFEGGRSSQRDLDQASALLEQARAAVPQFEAERRAALYALAQLTGKPPAEADSAAAACRQVPVLRQLVPVGDGAALLARRPDVRQAERQLAADTARIGIATAELFPKINLLGSVSLGSTEASDLGKSRSFSWSIGPLISWSFPNISVARARIRQAEAGADASLATFDGTVLTALTEVEQALARYAGALDRNAALARAEASSASAARLSRIRFDYGSDSFLQLIDSERERASARAALAESAAALADAQVSLFKALGGGWEDAVEAVARPAVSDGAAAGE